MTWPILSFFRKKGSNGPSTLSFFRKKRSNGPSYLAHYVHEKKAEEKRLFSIFSERTSRDEFWPRNRPLGTPYFKAKLISLMVD